MSFGPFETAGAPSDFLIEVAKGNVPGHETRSVVALLPSSGLNVFEQIWSEGGVLSLPVAAETWEIVSDDVNDTALGTGARAVLVTYLDDSYAVQDVLAVLDGTTPVTLNSDHFRPENSSGASGGQSIVVQAGSAQANIGKLTIRQAGGGLVRQTILPEASISQNTQYTVPADKTVLGLQNIFLSSKNNDGEFRSSVRPNFPGAARIQAGAGPFYQNSFIFPFKSPFVVQAGTDVAYEGKASNEGTALTVIVEFLLIDNEVLP